ncbi:MAG: hypothetical protein ACTTHU_00435 [Treponema sp.]
MSMIQDNACSFHVQAKGRRVSRRVPALINHLYYFTVSASHANMPYE